MERTMSENTLRECLTALEAVRSSSFSIRPRSHIDRARLAAARLAIVNDARERCSRICPSIAHAVASGETPDP